MIYIPLKLQLKLLFKIIVNFFLEKFSYTVYNYFWSIAEIVPLLFLISLEEKGKWPNIENLQNLNLATNKLAFRFLCHWY